MPLIETNNYVPPFPLKNGHLNTIYPALFRRCKEVSYERLRIDMPDGDFIDLDFRKVGSRTIAVVTHGLEGSSEACYVKGICKALNKAQWDAVAFNLRGCSGEPNRLYHSYHSGATQDLNEVIAYLIKQHKYKHILLVGFSLGGNIILKYVGEQGPNISTQVASAVAISVPCNLQSAAMQMAKPANILYLNRFMKSLKKKITYKKEKFPEAPFSKQDVEKTKNFYEIDNLYTAPAHGFKDAQDYWTKCSCKHFLKDIAIPTLLINARDDPFLTPDCFPFKNAQRNSCLYLEMPKYGGHVGFTKQLNLKQDFWHEERIVCFCKQYILNTKI